MAWRPVPTAHGAHWHGVPCRYAWTRDNAHFVLASNDCVAFGGGGQFALYLDSSLEFGSSGRSATFGNECLAGSADFKCIKVRVPALPTRAARARAHTRCAGRFSVSFAQLEVWGFV
jgi:hypothetical protein